MGMTSRMLAVVTALNAVGSVAGLPTLVKPLLMPWMAFACQAPKLGDPLAPLGPIENPCWMTNPARAGVTSAANRNASGRARIDARKLVKVVFSFEAFGRIGSRTEIHAHRAREIRVSEWGDHHPGQGNRSRRGIMQHKTSHEAKCTLASLGSRRYR